ncbi:MAG: hypothetical protein ACLUV4_02855 [Prevotella sp.]
MFSKEAREGARLDEKGRSSKKGKDRKDKKRKDRAARRERTKRKDPLVQITNNLFLRHYDKYNIYIL